MTAIPGTPPKLSPEAVKQALDGLKNMSPQEQLALLEDLDKLEKQQKIVAARDDFLTFCHLVYPGFLEGPHHRFLNPKLKAIKDGANARMTISMPPRFGKQLDHDTPVLTQNRGWVRHGDLVVGDRVFHPSGNPVEVLWISPETAQDCEVEFFDGSVIKCHENHEWTLYDRASATWRTVDTKYLEKQALLPGGRARFQLPGICAVQFPTVNLPIDPYFLGAWLGDGRASATDICGVKDDLDKIVARVPHTFGSRWIHKTTGVHHQNFLGLYPALRALGVLNNKHIPQLYLRSDETQRRELLAGLVDTDGTQDKTGRFHFNSASRALSENVLELVQSLGYRASIIEIPEDTRQRAIRGKAYWRVSWTPHDGLGGGYLPRKVAYRVRKRRQIGLKEVRRVAPTMGRCIEVNSQDGLYLAGRRLTPTHNSETISYLFVAWYLGHFPTHHIMMVTHTATLSSSFGRKIRNLIDSPVYQSVFPDTKVSKDKSAADDWTTTLGGKYLAIGIGANVAGHGAHLLIADDLCVSQNAAIITQRGVLPAKDVVVGDRVLGFGGWARVIRRADTLHFETVSVDGAIMSIGHPVWVFGRGWQYAVDLLPGDIVQTTCVFDMLRSTYVKNTTRLRAILSRVQHLGNDEAALPKSKGGELLQLWRQRNWRGPALRKIFGFFCGHGASTHAEAHTGSYRQRQKLLTGELSVGGYGYTTKQPHERSAFRTQWKNAVGPATGAHGWRSIVCDGASIEGDVSYTARGDGVPEGQLGAAPRHTEDFGWARRYCARLLGRSRQMYAAAREKRGLVAQTRVACHKALQVLVGFFVGVRCVNAVSPAPGQELVCFSVDGDNTFYADKILTHNCSEQAVLGNPEDAFNTAWEYMQVGPFQRLMPGGRILMIATRWGTRDPIGRALSWAKTNPLSPQWDEIRFPAIMPSGKSLWPQQWPIEQLIAKRESMYPQFWSAQYQQAPTNEEGALIKREWWQKWEDERAPRCEYIIMALDAAAEMTNRSDKTAITTWGVFADDVRTQGAHHIILLDCINERMEFPKLKDTALEQWRRWDPDCFIVERKSNGAALYQELRRLGIPVQEYTPSRASGDKFARLNAVSDIFRSGLVWYPAGHNWAEEVVEQVASFPNGDGDDIVDTTSMALARFRNGGFIRLPSDEDEVREAWRRKRVFY